MYKQGIHLVSFYWLVIAISNGLCKGQGYKRWMPSTNFEEPGNWDSGKIPCSRDRVVFPENAPPVFIQVNATLTELVLPLEGELVLGNYVSLSFPAQPMQDSNCPGNEVKYNHSEPDSWYDIKQWCVTSDSEGDCSVSQPLVLDSEKIPCQYDTAIFPQGRSFLVGLDSGVDIYVNALILDGRRYTTGSFRRFLDSNEGRKQFIRSSEGVPTTINIRADSCSDASGCICGNDKTPIITKLCEKVECEEIQCEKSFVPMGSCCATCGALLELEYTQNFKISSLKNMVERNYLKKFDKYNGVKYIASKTSLDHIQLVLLDDVQGENASQLGKAVADYLKRDMTSNQRYGISHVDITVSGSHEPQKQESRKENEGKGSKSTIAIVVTFLIILLIIIIVLCVVLRRSHRRPLDYLPKLNSFKSSFRNFNRFSMSSEDKCQLDVAPSVGFSDTVTMSELSRGFDNPMYSEPGAMVPQEPPQDGDDVIDTTDLHLANGTSNGFTNPLYGDGTVEELVHGDLGVASMLQMNPVFTTEGIEEDSEI